MHVLNMYVKTRQFHKVDMYLDEIKKTNHFPMHIYSSLVNEYGKQRNFKKVEKYMNEIRSKRNIDVVL